VVAERNIPIADGNYDGSFIIPAKGSKDPENNRKDEAGEKDPGFLVTF
jgi:hypothetical protein